MVAGLMPDELKRGTLKVEFGGMTIPMLNPIACLKAKLHNVRTIDQRERQDEKHVRILIPCIRGFGRRLIGQARRDDNYRLALNALKQLVLFTSHRQVVKTAHAYGFDLVQ